VNASVAVCNNVLLCVLLCVCCSLVRGYKPTRPCLSDADTESESTSGRGAARHGSRHLDLSGVQGSIGMLYVMLRHAVILCALAVCDADVLHDTV
jgi:hypothetical protein